MGEGIGCIAFKRLVKCPDCLFRLFGLDKSNAAVVMRQCIRGIECKGTVECADRLVIPFPAGQGNAQIIQTFRIVRFKGKGFLKRQDRIVILLPLGKGNAFMVQGFGILRREFEGLVIGDYGFKGFSEAGQGLSPLKKCTGTLRSISSTWSNARTASSR